MRPENLKRELVSKVRCWKCGYENLAGRRFCQSCSVILPIDILSVEVRSLELSPTVNAAPAKDYPNLALQQLLQSVEAYWEGQADDILVADYFDQLQELFEELSQNIPHMEQAVRDHLASAPSDEQAHQISYLMRVGEDKMREGLESLKRSFPESETATAEALASLQQGNNFLCYAAEVTDEILQRF